MTITRIFTPHHESPACQCGGGRFAQASQRPFRGSKREGGEGESVPKSCPPKLPARSGVSGWAQALACGAGVMGCAAIVLALAAPGVQAGQSDTSKDAPFRYDAHGRRDPFMALVRDGHVVGVPGGMTGAGSMPVLYGIVWDPSGQSIALIDDREVKVGETIDGYKVQEIRKDAVVINTGGEPIVLRIVFDAAPAKRPPGTTTGGKHR